MGEKMKIISRLLLLVSLITVIQSTFPQAAHAYINPGTGTYIMQIIIGALIGGTLAIKFYWRKIMHFIRKLFKGKQEK